MLSIFNPQQYGHGSPSKRPMKLFQLLRDKFGPGLGRPFNDC